MKIVKNISHYREILPATAFPEYLQLMNNACDYGYIIDGECILPYTKRRRLIFYYIQLSTPVLGAKDEIEEKKFLDKAIPILIKSVSADYIFSANTAIFKTYPEGSIFCKFGTYVINLEKPKEEIFAGLHIKTRNAVRKAQKDGLIFLHGACYLDDCYKIINETFSRQNLLAPSRDYIEKLCSLDDNIFICIIKDCNKVHASGIFIWNKNHGCYALHCGTAVDIHRGAMRLLEWETILWMKKNGARYFDFVGARIHPDKGSRLEGIQEFKSKFGGDLIIGYMWKYIFNNFRYQVYSFLLILYFKYIRGEKYEGDAIDQERKRGNY